MKLVNEFKFYKLTQVCFRYICLNIKSWLYKEIYSILNLRKLKI